MNDLTPKTATGFSAHRCLAHRVRRSQPPQEVRWAGGELATTLRARLFGALLWQGSGLMRVLCSLVFLL